MPINQPPPQRVVTGREDDRVEQSVPGQPAIIEPFAVLAHALHSALEENLHLAGRRLAGFGLGLPAHAGPQLAPPRTV